tara:strand:- start:8894 stop:9151 length:258 start_codon:yes stop_codon:yes gene_type:complete
MSGLAPYSLSELSLFVVSCITAMGTLCAVAGKILATSRCNECSCCCIKCKNDPLEKEELEALSKIDLEAPKQLVKKENSDILPNT